CSGRGGMMAFQGSVRERHVVRSTSVARGGCSGSAMTFAPTKFVVADLPKPAAAPQPMPKGPPPVVVVPMQTCEPPLAGARVRSVAGASVNRLGSLLCSGKEAMVAIVTAPLHLRSKEVHREFHLLKR